MKKIGVLFPTRSQLPSSVYTLTANPRGSLTVSALPRLTTYITIIIMLTTIPDNINHIHEFPGLNTWNLTTSNPTQPQSKSVNLPTVENRMAMGVLFADLAEHLGPAVLGDVMSYLQITKCPCTHHMYPLSILTAEPTYLLP